MWLKRGVPVFARGPRTVQVGLHRPLMFEDLSAPESEFLASLESAQRPITGRESEHFESLVSTLAAHGAIDATRERPLREFTVRVHGGGPLGLAIALGLARAGVGAQHVVDPAPARHEPPHTYPLAASSGTCASAAAWTLREAFPLVRWASAHARADLEVVVRHGAIEPELLADFMANDRVHVPVVTDESGVTIGPVVIPGNTPCQRCVGLARTEHEPSWPAVALQCGPSRRPHTTPWAIDVAAGIVTRESFDVLTGSAPSWRSWRVDSQAAPGDLPLSACEVRAHPECGCGASGPIGDEVAARRARIAVVPGTSDTSDTT